jgi:hypothetical protein
MYFKASVGNALGATTTLNPGNTPNVNTPAGVGSAYVIPTFNEANIELNQDPGDGDPGGVGNTSACIGIRRMRNTATSTPQSPALSNIVDGGTQFSVVSVNDAILNPLTMLIASTSKYLTLKVTFNGALSQFAIRLGGSVLFLRENTTMFLKWVKSSSESAWFNAKISSSNTGGCETNGGTNTNNTYSITRPSTVSGSTFSGVYDVYVVIGYTGNIKFTEINVT